jgi:hypothetical protein
VLRLPVALLLWHRGHLRNVDGGALLIEGDGDERFLYGVAVGLGLVPALLRLNYLAGDSSESPPFYQA